MDDLDGLSLLLRDLRVTLLLLNEGRFQLLHKAFGISREEANVVTLLLLASAAAAMQEKLDAIREPPSREAVADMWLGAAAVRELASGIAGPALRNTPLTGELVMVVALAAGARPAWRAWNQLRPGRRLGKAFWHRYGHHVHAMRRQISTVRSAGAAAVKGGPPRPGEPPALSSAPGAA